MKFWREIERAVKLLRSGEVVGVPTETVYGLAASITNENALEKIFRVKSRPYFDPLIVHTHSASAAKALVRKWPPLVSILANEFWPGPMTLVLPKNNFISDRITAGLDTVGVRVPAHPFARRISKELGNPFAAPSANLFGRTSPTTAQHVKDEFSDEIFVVDGGPCKIGLESTVLQIEDNLIRILRPGMLNQEHLASLLEKHKILAHIEQAESQASPGHLKAHYQPRVPLLLAEGDSAKLPIPELLKKGNLPSDSRIFEIELGDDPFICAREIYSNLRKPALTEYDFILIRWKSKYSSFSWTAIRDRLERAAQFKI